MNIVLKVLNAVVLFLGISCLPLYAQTPQLLMRTGHLAYIQAVAFSPDGRFLAVSAGKQPIRIWDIHRIQEVGSLSEGAGSLAFSPNGRVLAGGNFKNVALWDVQTRRKLGALPVYTGGPISGPLPIAIDPEGRLLASGDDTGTVTFWDMEKRQKIQTLAEYNNDEVESIAFSPDGRLLAIGLGASVKLWDMQTLRETFSLKMNVIENGRGILLGIASLSFDPRSQLLANSIFRTVEVWNVQTGERIHRFAHSNPVTAVAFSPDGHFLVSGSGETTTLWNIQTGQAIRTLASSPFQAMVFSPDGRFLAIGCGNGVVEMWDWMNGREVVKLIGFDEHEWAVVTPDGYFDASSGAKQYLYWDFGDHIYEIAQYKGQYYRPGLLAEIFKQTGK